MNKKSVRLGRYVVELRDPSMTDEDAMAALESYVMHHLVRDEVAGELLLRLLDYFGSEDRPVSAIELFEFWSALDLYEQLPYLLFAENELIPAQRPGA